MIRQKKGKIINISYEYVMQNTPLKCVGKTVDVAAAVLYLAAPVSDYVTGQFRFTE